MSSESSDLRPEQSEGDTQPRTSPVKKRSSGWRFLRELALIVIIALLISTAVKTWFVRAFYIPSASMEHTLNVGDRVLVNRLAVPLNTIERGSIVVFDDPGNWLPPSVSEQYSPNPVLEFLGLVPADAGHQLIKRVIGVGGDTVTCCNAQGQLEVNGVGINESYLSPGVTPSEVEFSVKVPNGKLWVMGDNRSNSADSRYHTDEPGAGFVPVDNVVGTVFVINWPLDRFRWVSAPEAVFARVP